MLKDLKFPDASCMFLFALGGGSCVIQLESYRQDLIEPMGSVTEVDVSWKLTGNYSK